MATENILMAAVEAGGDRQDLHERIRQHSQAAAAMVKEQGSRNDLLDRLESDPAFAKVDLAATTDPMQYVGRAPEQVDEFIAEIVAPIRAKSNAPPIQTRANPLLEKRFIHRSIRPRLQVRKKQRALFERKTVESPLFGSLMSDFQDFFGIRTSCATTSCNKVQKNRSSLLILRLNLNIISFCSLFRSATANTAAQLR
jgi:hypothetical protein